MLSVYVCADDASDAIHADLLAAGCAVAGAGPAGSLLRDVLRSGAQILVAQHRAPAAALLPALAALREHAPLPVLLFTADGEAQTLAAALASGVDECVVHGYAAARLRPLLLQTRLRFDREQAARAELAALAERFEERKLVDRAKGILMGAGQLPEDEAFRLLRVGSMRLKQRVGQVSQQVIDAARCAQAINSAGALRMLSQRIVLHRALGSAGVQLRAATQEVQAALARAEAKLGELDKLLSSSTYGDLLAAAQDDWRALAMALAHPEPRASVGKMAALTRLDQLAELCVQSADRLVAALEAVAFGGEPHVVNVCGRQRMLGQRLAKQALLACMAEAGTAQAAAAQATQALRATQAEFEHALAILTAAPLGDALLRERLQDGAHAWDALLQSTLVLDTASGRSALADASEALLRIFDELTGRYERSLELLIG